ncbi:GDSL-type esterase/lipase family protein [Luteimonas sp. S4-F44]|uniref:GDSL-type esterase/lipase family protein n=1 Tax=Luteimonas sp. S4-F44 TaxID=2925842 RepID=UPI001F53853A|nr:GDSL-type esterase/lipase family protein [Luteimonas sp. S4-F44]UNK41862.1 GDSL-type esterase/lipase family protein [Luteimonas sp. S4-F44]
MKRLLSLLCLGAVGTAFAASPAPHRIFIAGDSTAAAYGPERAPQAGWGQALPRWIADGWEVRNHAMGGRSTRSFIDEGRLDAIASELGAGDVLLIQFGHNDAKREDPTRYTDPATDYPRLLQRYIDAARDQGATPILITPVARLLYDFRSLIDTHGRYTLAMQALAAREGVALIDLDAASSDWIRAHGEDGAKPYFMHVPAQGKADGTHFSEAGADAVACLVAAGWRELDADAPVKPVTAADCNALPAPPSASVSPSVVVQERDIAIEQPGPHEGAGTTTAYPFFSDATGLDLVFRKRALHPGATIGDHVNDKDEIYYVLSGRGRLVLGDTVREVGPGDAILTRDGDRHALDQIGDEDLVIFIVYRPVRR